TCSGDLGNAVDGYLELALDHLIYFFLRMEVLMNGRATHKIIVRECHARRVEIASVPTGQALNDAKAGSIDKRHGTLLLEGILARPPPGSGRIVDGPEAGLDQNPGLVPGRPLFDALLHLRS